MTRFKDDKTRALYAAPFVRGIPDRVSVPAHQKLQLLMAACSIQDIGVVGPIIRWINAPDRYGLRIIGKWYVTFAWDDEFGANEIGLERR